MDSNERPLRDIAGSDAIEFGTTAPCRPSHFRITKIGFADIPVVELEVACRPRDLSALTPVVRQLVFQKLQAHDVSPDVLKFTPTVAVGRTCLFVDVNPRSPTAGKKKRGAACAWHFEILQRDAFVWDWKTGKFKDQVLKTSST